MVTEAEIMDAGGEILTQTRNDPLDEAIVKKEHIEEKSVAEGTNTLSDLDRAAWNEKWTVLGAQMFNYVQGLITEGRKHKSALDQKTPSASEYEQIATEVEHLRKRVRIQDNMIMALKTSRDAMNREIRRYSEVVAKESREQIKALLEANAKAEMKIQELQEELAKARGKTSNQALQ